MFLAFLFLVTYLLSKTRGFRVKQIDEINKSIYEKICAAITKLLKRKALITVDVFYKRLLRHSNLTVADIIIAKVMILFFVMVLIFSVRATNINMITEKIIGTFEYNYDAIYQISRHEINTEKALEDEIRLFNALLEKVTIKELQSMTREEIQTELFVLTKKLGIEFELPEVTAVNKVFYRITDYLLTKEIDVASMLFIIIFCCSIPELVLIILNFFSRKNAKKELRFLKRLIILNGSIAPASFMETLSILISKSKYYANTLKEIKKMNNKNSIDSKTIYTEFVANSKDIDLKLFYEKLDQANNYNFTLAVENIKNEFYIEKRREIRAVKKQMEVINAWGIIGCFILIAMLTMYMLIPWLLAYEMSRLI
ncbi:MAG: hypothetical protein LR001_00805 [Clostridiales bacterium]|nr:hypothetical protein [Clostridiales bacterium]